MTTTTREKFEEQFCFKQTDDGVTHYPSLRTNIDQTESIWSFIETIEKEAEERGIQQGREEVRNEIDLWVGAVHPNSEELDAFISSL